MSVSKDRVGSRGGEGQKKGEGVRERRTREKGRRRRGRDREDGVGREVMKRVKRRVSRDRQYLVT